MIIIHGDDRVATASHPFAMFVTSRHALRVLIAVWSEIVVAKQICKVFARWHSRRLLDKPASLSSRASSLLPRAQYVSLLGLSCGSSRSCGSQNPLSSLFSATSTGWNPILRHSLSSLRSCSVIALSQTRGRRLAARAAAIRSASDGRSRDRFETRRRSRRPDWPRSSIRRSDRS